MATLEDAKVCPKCGLTGALRDTFNKGAGVSVRVYVCGNERCQWYDTGWPVQVNADGSIPEYKPGPKQYEPLTPGMKATGKKILEVTEEQLRRGEV